MESTTTRRPCFLEEDNGLASIAGIEHGFSSSSSSSSSSSETHHHGSTHLLSRPLYSPRKATLRNLSSFSSVSSPRSARFFEEQPPHFLDSCFLCKKRLGSNRDIFMYRGDTPFCSEECRAEQIDLDEVKEKNKNLSASMKALRMKEQSEKSSNKTSKKYPFHSGAVAAA